MKSSIYIIGLTGCGKSSLSKMLANYLSYNFFDLDNLIEDRQGITISEIFKNNGEPYFRDLETNILKEVSSKVKSVISTGGGIIVRDENIDIMNSSGTVIFIDRSPEIIAEHIDTSKRPLVKGNLNHIFELHKKRYELYKKASDIIFKYDHWDNDVSVTFENFINEVGHYINDKL